MFMYCPRCGEQQSSGNLRFCNRCGLPLGLVSEVVSNEGTLPQLEETLKKKKWLTRGNGLKFSIVWFAIWFFITMLTALGGGDEGSAIVFVIGFFGSIFMMLLSFLFLKSDSKTKFTQNPAHQNYAVPQNLSGQKENQNALPPQQQQPAKDYVAPHGGMWKAPETGDLVSQGSVTEGTTKLLSKEEQEETGSKHFDKHQ